MARLCRCLSIFLALICGVVSLHAASSAEDRAYDVADRAFKIQSWDYAEKRFGEFVLKYPKSSRVPAAILFQARARYRLKRFADAIGLLSANENRAGIWEDEYLYWTAQAYLQTRNFQAAAAVFARVSRDFPDSPRRLEATVEEAAALAWSGDWPRVTQLLQETNGVFQQAAGSDPADVFVLQGYLILGEAELALKEFNSVQSTLDFLGGRTFAPELMWRREYLRCRLQLESAQPEQALASTTNLLALAGALVPAGSGINAAPAQINVRIPQQDIPTPALLSETWSFRGGILEQLKRPDDAIAAYQNNLVTNAPPDYQRQALLKIAQLYLAQGQYALATKTLEDYLNQHPDSAAGDMALLTIGELKLKQFATAVSGDSNALSQATTLTNLIPQALARFDTLLAALPQSPLTGKALLDKGWCLWSDGRYAQSEEAFRMAAERLPFSEDQAVARFKWADAQFMLRDFVGAIANYNSIVTHYTTLAGLNPQLFELALYQTVRAALPDDMAAATEAMRRILESYPNSFAGPHCLLLLGQNYTRRSDPAGARELFADFARRYPTNALLPEVSLAVARSYEEERNWDAAIGQYTGWIAQFTNHAEFFRALPRAEFFRAWDHYMAGRETNAFVSFTNFMVRFPTNDLARDAQYWIGDYYWGRGDFQNAEINYQLVFKSTNWPPLNLTYQAQMMAGRAAIARLDYKDAITYFTNLAGNAACPLDLRIQATIACGDALSLRTDPGATNRPADLQEAISWFSTIPQTYPTHPLAPVALGRMGDCCLQLGDSDPKFYDKAAGFYQEVINSPQAQFPARSQARIGLGLVAEGMAKLKSGSEQTALLNQALEDYQDVFFYERMLRNGEEPDPFWVKKAGLEAARLAESLQQWPLAINLYGKLEEWLPQMRSSLDKKILSAQKSLASEKK